MPHQPHPWDPPPLPERGDATEDITFAAVGRALTGWEIFEQSFALLFAVILGAQPSYAAMRAYGSVLTFRGRSEMVKQAAEAHFQQFPNRDVLAQLRQLLKDANNYSPRRNEIAHGFVRPYAETNANLVGEGFVLCPSDYATNKTEITFLTMGMSFGRPFRFIKPRYAYSSVEIDALGQRFRELAPVVVPIRAEVIRLGNERQASR
jgi:hypothetical protein